MLPRASAGSKELTALDVGRAKAMPQRPSITIGLQVSEAVPGKYPFSSKPFQKIFVYYSKG